MVRRYLLRALLIPVFLRAQDPAKHITLRGKLVSGAALEVADGKTIQLEGDRPTEGVIKDKRLFGKEFELIGDFAAPDRFRILPIHLKAMFVHQNGKKLFVTYWCDVCSIRTYTPGTCWCCQEETQLDLRERYEQ